MTRSRTSIGNDRKSHNRTSRERRRIEAYSHANKAACPSPGRRRETSNSRTARPVHPAIAKINVESKHYIDGMVSSASTALINVSTELATFLNKLHSNADDEMPQETIKNLSEHIGKETQSGLVAIANRIQSVVNTQQIEIQNLMNRRQAVQKRINDLCKELELVPEAQTKYIPCGHSSPCSSMECVEITKLATKSYNDVQVEVEREVKEKRAFERNFINLFK